MPFSLSLSLPLSLSLYRDLFDSFLSYRGVQAIKPDTCAGLQQQSVSLTEVEEPLSGVLQAHSISAEKGTKPHLSLELHTG